MENDDKWIILHRKITKRVWYSVIHLLKVKEGVILSQIVYLIIENYGKCKNMLK